MVSVRCEWENGRPVIKNSVVLFVSTYINYNVSCMLNSEQNVQECDATKA